MQHIDFLVNLLALPGKTGNVAFRKFRLFCHKAVGLSVICAIFALGFSSRVAYAADGVVTVGRANTPIGRLGVVQYVSVNAASAAGLTQLEMQVNGQPMGSLPARGTEYNAVFSFKPEQVGDYRIQVIAKDGAGAFIPSAEILILVREPVGSVIDIPAGAFKMGDNGGQPDERPEREVNLNAYQVDRYEVTVGEFRRFVWATQYKTSAEQANKPREETWRADEYGLRFEFPVRFISWWDADRYCSWVGKRLLTEAEWERAARGIEGRKYPWGNDFDPARVPSNQDLTAVGQFANGLSAAGNYDLAGNVWEWVQDWYDPQFYSYPNVNNNPRGPENGDQKALRGGSFSNGPDDLRTTRRIKNDAGSSHRDVGFRCGKQQ